MVIYEQIRFCEIKSNLNPHALSWYAEKEKASLSQGGLQTKPSSSAQTAALQRKGRLNMSYDKVQVGNRIRGSRLEKGWTQERLAAEAEISVQQLRALEKGQRNLGVDHLGRLSDAMGVSSDFLLKGCSENSILVCKMLDDLKKNCSRQSKSQKNERFCRKNSIF